VWVCVLSLTFLLMLLMHSHTCTFEFVFTCAGVRVCPYVCVHASACVCGAGVRVCPYVCVHASECVCALFLPHMCFFNAPIRICIINARTKMSVVTHHFNKYIKITAIFFFELRSPTRVKLRRTKMSVVTRFFYFFLCVLYVHHRRENENLRSRLIPLACSVSVPRVAVSCTVCCREFRCVLQCDCSVFGESS